MSIIDGATCNGSTTTGCQQAPVKAAVGDFPAGLAVDHAEHTVYVVDNRGTSITVIRAAG